MSNISTANPEVVKDSMEWIYRDIEDTFCHSRFNLGYHLSLYLGKHNLKPDSFPNITDVHNQVCAAFVKDIARRAYELGKESSNEQTAKARSY